MLYDTFSEIIDRIERENLHDVVVKKPTNEERLRVKTDKELAKYLVEIGWDCHLCSEHERLENEPLLRGEKCDENCEKHCLEWLKSPAED